MKISEFRLAQIWSHKKKILLWSKQLDANIDWIEILSNSLEFVLSSLTNTEIFFSVLFLDEPSQVCTKIQSNLKYFVSQLAIYALTSLLFDFFWFSHQKHKPDRIQFQITSFLMLKLRGLHWIDIYFLFSLNSEASLKLKTKVHNKYC